MSQRAAIWPTVMQISGRQRGESGSAPCSASTPRNRSSDPADQGISCGIKAPDLEIVPVSREILLDAAALRARQKLRTPDAIQLATGIRAGATLAVSNDKLWRSVPLIETALLSDLAP